jgi:hypothetical protein
MTQRRFKVARFDFEEVQRNAASARGRLLYLRPKGMEGLFTLRAPAPVEARLEVSTEASAKLPEGLVPFTLFVEVEKAPRSTPGNTRIEIPIPPELCARENLDKLGVYACEPQGPWSRLEIQQVDAEKRMFTAEDDQAARVYAVLGPEGLRATRMVIPGENEPRPPSEKAPVPMPAPMPAPAPETTPAAPAEPSGETIEPPPLTPPRPQETMEKPQKKARVLWGRPQPPKQKPLVMPNREDVANPDIPRLDVSPLLPRNESADKAEAGEAPKNAKNKEKPPTAKNTKRKTGRKPAQESVRPNSASVKHNFNLGPPARPPDTSPAPHKGRESNP